ncbi:protein of unknown function [Caballeronia sp. S22]
MPQCVQGLTTSIELIMDARFAPAEGAPWQTATIKIRGGARVLHAAWNSRLARHRHWARVPDRARSARRRPLSDRTGSDRR